MNIEWNWKTILIWSIVLIMLIGTNVAQYFWIWKPKIEQLTLSYESEIAHLEETLQRIGPMVTIWTINDENAEIFPGKVIEESDLSTMQLPESLIQPSFILDPASILGKYYRIGVSPGTPLSWDNIMAEPIEDSTREYDIVANILPIGLKEGDYIDFRIVYPLGEDYIVLSHKRVEAINGPTVKVRLNETEIHRYQASLVDYFMQSGRGAILYMTKYVEPGVQKPAEEYYAVPANVLTIMDIDPNIIEVINHEINNRYRANIEANIEAAEQVNQGALKSGRNEVSGKIGQGANEYENKLRELQEAEERARQEEALPPPSSNALPSDMETETAPDHVFETPGYDRTSAGDQTQTIDFDTEYADHTNPDSSSEIPGDYSIPADSPAFDIEAGVVE